MPPAQGVRSIIPRVTSVWPGINVIAMQTDRVELALTSSALGSDTGSAERGFVSCWGQLSHGNMLHDPPGQCKMG